MEKAKMKELKVEENVIREIKISFFLDHPNISKLYGVFNDSKRIYLVFELGVDYSLYDAMNRWKDGCLDAARVSRIVAQLCSALKCIHDN
jgi:serine/threonine protein kinase